jgi:hypothetical protein
MDQNLREYFERVEAFFCGQRGAPLLLSPLDFEKAVEWYAAGVPAEVVEVGVADYFARLSARKVPLRNAVCLAFAEDRILKALQAHRAAAVGRAAGVAEPGDPPEVRTARFLEERAAKLERFAADPSRGAAMTLCAKACADAALDLRALLPKAGLSVVTLEGKLQPLDRELCRLVLLESPQELVDRWRADARARLGDLAGGMEETSLRQTVEKLARQAAMEHWDLPRLSLLFMED